MKMERKKKVMKRNNLIKREIKKKKKEQLTVLAKFEQTCIICKRFPCISKLR